MDHDTKTHRDQWELDNNLHPSECWLVSLSLVRDPVQSFLLDHRSHLHYLDRQIRLGLRRNLLYLVDQIRHRTLLVRRFSFLPDHPSSHRHAFPCHRRVGHRARLCKTQRNTLTMLIQLMANSIRVARCYHDNQYSKTYGNTKWNSEYHQLVVTCNILSRESEWRAFSHSTTGVFATEPQQWHNERLGHPHVIITINDKISISITIECSISTPSLPSKMRTTSNTNKRQFMWQLNGSHCVSEQWNWGKIEGIHRNNGTSSLDGLWNVATIVQTSLCLI